jgi:hypothetical protein
VVARRVVNVTPRTRVQSFFDAAGLVSQAIGWLLVAAAALQAFGAVVAVLLALLIIALGRKLRDL